jgi:hypothetical protein
MGSICENHSSLAAWINNHRQLQIVTQSTAQQQGRAAGGKLGSHSATHLLPPAAPLPPRAAVPPSVGLEDRWRPPGEEGRESE